jgi:hypothetical protein
MEICELMIERVDEFRERHCPGEFLEPSQFILIPRVALREFATKSSHRSPAR